MCSLQPQEYKGGDESLSDSCAMTETDGPILSTHTKPIQPILTIGMPS